MRATPDVHSLPEVTVVVPTKNRWRALELALDSALRQEDVDVEVIVVDDGSRTEAPPRIEDDRRVRLLAHETSLGVARARNTGIAAARGEWVAFLDDDDIWSPRKLRAQLDTASSQEASFVYSDVLALDERLRPTAVLAAPDPETLAASLLHQQVIPAGASNVTVATALVRSLGGFDENLVQLADWDLWIRMAQSGRAAASREVLVGWVKHPENMLLTKRQSIFRELEYLIEKHRAASAELRAEFDRVGFVRWVAGGHGRAGRRFRAARLYLDCGLADRNVRDFARAARILLGPRPMRMRRRAIPPERAIAWLARYRELQARGTEPAPCSRLRAFG